MLVLNSIVLIFDSIVVFHTIMLVLDSIKLVPYSEV